MKLRSVQALRGLAALAVALTHLRWTEAVASGEAPILSELWQNGVSGVDLFFVISGFIMVWVAGEAPRGASTAGSFLFARAGRIYPLWWLFAAIACAKYFYAVGVPTEPDHKWGDASFFVRSFLLLPQPDFPVLALGWTLVHEVYFYVAFAGLLLVPTRWRVPVLVAWAGGVVWGASAGLSPGFARDLPSLVFHPMTLEFLLGSAVGVLIQRGRRPAPLAFAVAGGLAFAFSAVSFDFDESWQAERWGRVLAFGVPGASIVYGVVGLELADRMIPPRFLSALGDWSYSLYLGHIIVLNTVARIWFPMWGGPGRLDNILFNLVGLVAILWVAWVSYRLVEAPTVRWFARRRSEIFRAR